MTSQSGEEAFVMHEEQKGTLHKGQKVCTTPPTGSTACPLRQHLPNQWKGLDLPVSLVGPEMAFKFTVIANYLQSQGNPEEKKMITCK